jgi:hypothetical protein
VATFFRVVLRFESANGLSPTPPDPHRCNRHASPVPATPAAHPNTPPLPVSYQDQPLRPIPCAIAGGTGRLRPPRRPSHGAGPVRRTGRTAQALLERRAGRWRGWRRWSWRSARAALGRRAQQWLGPGPAGSAAPGARGLSGGRSVAEGGALIEGAAAAAGQGAGGGGGAQGKGGVF